MDEQKSIGRAIVMVSGRDVLRLFPRPGQEAVQLPTLVGVPEGAEIVAVHYDYRHSAFALVVEHVDLPEVFEGAELPTLGRGLMADMGEYRLRNGPCWCAIDRLCLTAESAAISLLNWDQDDTERAALAEALMVAVAKYRAEAE